jgi:hypothetical protein
VKRGALAIKPVTPSAADAAAPLPLAGEVDALDRARRVGVSAKQHALPVSPRPGPPPQERERERSAVAAG